MRFVLRIARNTYDQMLAQARAELPNECCGLLAGRILTKDGPLTELPVAQVLNCYPLVNQAANPREYLSDPRGMFDAIRDMRRRGTDIIAVYHSHPSSDPIPSRTDLERNYSEDVINLIISLKSAEPVMRGWWLTATDYREAEWECVDE